MSIYKRASFYYLAQGGPVEFSVTIMFYICVIQYSSH